MSDDHWLLLHGTPLGPSVWSAVAGHLGGRVWAPEMTPVPGTTAPQRHLATALAEQAGTSGRRWRVVGHSFGGQIALEFAALAPDLVQEVVVVCSRDTAFPAFAAVADNLDAGSPVEVDATLGRWFRPAEIAARPVFVDEIAARLRQADRHAWATALRGIATYDGAATTAAITVPGRVIAADHDAVGTPDAMSELAHRLRRAEFTVVEDASHLSLFLRPTRFAALLTGPSRPS